MGNAAGFVRLLGMRWTTLLELDDGLDSSIGVDGPRMRVNKDPWSWITHFAGMIAAAIGTIYLVLNGAGGIEKRSGMVIYGGSLTLCMATSAAYHYFDLGTVGNRWLRRADHSAIFLLIGGTFVPACLHLLTGSWRTGMLIGMAIMASTGILFKLAWLDAPRWLSTGIYVAMGWSVFIPAPQMWPNMSMATVTWLVAGGAFYTFGAIIYGTRRPNPLPNVFGFHEIWHLLVLAGAACHYAFAYSFCDAPCLPL